MSILRKSNVPLSYLLDVHVPCHHVFRSHVTKTQNVPCHPVDFRVSGHIIILSITIMYFFRIGYEFLWQWK